MFDLSIEENVRVAWPRAGRRVRSAARSLSPVPACCEDMRRTRKSANRYLLAFPASSRFPAPQGVKLTKYEERMLEEEARRRSLSIQATLPPPFSFP